MRGCENNAHTLLEELLIELGQRAESGRLAGEILLRLRVECGVLHQRTAEHLHVRMS